MQSHLLTGRTGADAPGVARAVRIPARGSAGHVAAGRAGKGEVPIGREWTKPLAPGGRRALACTRGSATSWSNMEGSHRRGSGRQLLGVRRQPGRLALAIFRLQTRPAALRSTQAYRCAERGHPVMTWESTQRSSCGTSSRTSTPALPTTWTNRFIPAPGSSTRDAAIQ